MLKVIIDPANNIFYSSFYIKGFLDVFGGKNVTYENRYFSDVSFAENIFAFILQGDKHITKFIIDYADASTVNDPPLAWCDFYLKINIDPEKNYATDKLISIGPGFGIRFLSLSQTISLALRNYVKARKRIKMAKQFFYHYISQWKRPLLSDYYPNRVEENYVFFAGSLWKKEVKTNTFRGNYITACKNVNTLKFEGGFAPRKNRDIRGFEAQTMQTRIPMNDYMKKMSKSLVAFNTPAVQGCHGWKLGEFFCFGKAIISTPITRKLPKDLEDREHFILTTGEEEDIETKLKELIHNKALREKLETNSRKYYETVLAPEILALRIKELHHSSGKNC